MKSFTQTTLSTLFLSLALGLSACGQSNPNELGDCGNGTTEEGEQCDDGNIDGGDGCSESCEVELPSSNPEIDEYILGLGQLPPVQSDKESGPLQPFDSGNDNYECTTQTVTQTESLSDVSVLSVDTNFIFPGSILRGDSLTGGGFTETAFDRKPLTYSLSVLDGGSAPRSATMQNPNLAEFRDTIGGVLEQANLGDIAIASNVTLQEVKSETELDFSLGVGVNSPQFDLKGKFDFASENIRSHYLVTIDTVFFTADANAIVNPSDVFADNVTLDEIEQKFSDGNPPVYISSVSYGSRIYIAIDSEFDSQELAAAVEASFSNGAITVDGSTSLTQNQVLQNSSIDLVAIGASAEQVAAFNAALASADPIAAVKNVIQTPSLFDAGSIGFPVSFRMKYLADNQPAAFGLTGSFDAVTCARISQNIEITLNSIKVTGINDTGLAEADDALELFGTITAVGLDSIGDSGRIFDVTSDNPRTIGNDAVTFGGAQNQTILQINPEEEGDIRIVVNLADSDGNNSDNIIGSLPTLFPFSQGFNRVNTLTFGTPQGQVEIDITMKPVF
jgi:cysteine-rich repeat protein